MDYRGARFYDADVGRFLSLDPLAADFVEWSAYNYVLGNPVGLVDPDGKAPIEGIVIKSSSKNADIRTRYQAEVFSELQKLTDDKLGLDKFTGQVFIIEHSASTEREYGTGLVRDLIEGFSDESGKETKPTVMLTDNADSRLTDNDGTPLSLENNAYTFPKSPSAASNGTGSDSKIYFQAGVKSQYKTSPTTKENAPAYIILGHELIHSKTNAVGKRMTSQLLPGHPAKNQEELNTQKQDNELFKENGLTERYIQE